MPVNQATRVHPEKLSLAAPVMQVNRERLEKTADREHLEIRAPLVRSEAPVSPEGPALVAVRDLLDHQVRGDPRGRRVRLEALARSVRRAPTANLGQGAQRVLLVALVNLEGLVMMGGRVPQALLVQVEHQEIEARLVVPGLVV